MMDNFVDDVVTKLKQTAESREVKLDELFRKFEDACKGGIWGLNSEFLWMNAMIKAKAAEIGKKVEDYFDDFSRTLETIGGWSGLFHYAMLVEEKVVETISFKECIAWVKSGLDAKIHGGAIIFRRRNEISLDSSAKRLTLKVCYTDKAGNPMPDEKSRHLLVRCNSVDAELQNAFGNRDMIVIK